MDIVDTLRNDKLFPGRKRWKEGKMTEIQSDSEKKKKKEFFLSVSFKMAFRIFKPINFYHHPV